VTLRRCTSLTFIAVAVLAIGLSGCGRRGPLELPPETQARGEALKKQQAQSASSDRTRPLPGAEEPAQPAPAIPGTIGNRPPDQYPFPLDPLL